MGILDDFERPKDSKAFRKHTFKPVSEVKSAIDDKMKTARMSRLSWQSKNRK